MEHWKNKSLEPITEFIEDVGWVTEEWKDCQVERQGIVHDYSGLYKVSNFGRMKTLSKGKRCRIKTEKILSQMINTGYLQVSLCNNGNQADYRVHRIVAYVFIPNPDNKREVNHKKGNRKDNRVSQIEWNTPSENSQHAYDIGLQKTNRLNVGGKKVGQYNLDWELIKIYNSMGEAQRETGIHRNSIGKSCIGKKNIIGGFRWRFI